MRAKLGYFRESAKLFSDFPCEYREKALPLQP